MQTLPGFGLKLCVLNLMDCRWATYIIGLALFPVFVQSASTTTSFSSKNLSNHEESPSGDYAFANYVANTLTRYS